MSIVEELVLERNAAMSAHLDAEARAEDLERRLIELQHAVQPLHRYYEAIRLFEPADEDWEHLARLMGWSAQHTKWSDIKDQRKNQHSGGQE